MASIVPRGLDYILYFDNWFCGVDLQVVLKKVGISSVGTVREARLKGCKLPSDKDLKKKGRGSYMEMATTFEGVSLRAVKWFDNRPVTLLSTFASASPEQAVKRFDKKTRTTVSIPRPAIVGIYNECMGGVDLLDMLVALYRIHNTVLLTLAAIMMSIAIETTNLHKRIALWVLLQCGQSLRNIMAGYTVATFLITLLLKNSATADIMVPVVDATVHEIHYIYMKDMYTQCFGADAKKRPSVSYIANALKLDDISMRQITTRFIKIRKVLLIMVAYTASLGSVGTLSGTITNYVTKMIVTSAMDFKKEDVHDAFLVKYRSLGKITAAEKVVVVVLAVVFFLWSTRRAVFFKGWANWFHMSAVDDTSVAFMAVAVLFAVPMSSDNLQKRILSWSVVKHKMAWGMLLTFGGGLALGVASEITQLSAEFVVVIESLNIQTPLQMQVLISLGAATLTEFTPNDAAATMLLPVVISLACKLRLNPLYLVFPVCLSVTQACIFPASSSVIAIICDEGHVTTKDLLIPGIIVKFFCQIVNLAFINTLGNYVFNLQTFPSWASACFSSAPSFGPIPH
nr:solute carrier family 13 member 2-like [Rhipicephalus microplus]